MTPPSAPATPPPPAEPPPTVPPPPPSVDPGSADAIPELAPPPPASELGSPDGGAAAGPPVVAPPPAPVAPPTVDTGSLPVGTRVSAAAAARAAAGGPPPPAPPPTPTPPVAPAPPPPPAPSVEPSAPGSPDDAPSAAPEAPPTRPTGDFVFSTSREERVAKHVRVLRANPDDASVPCWPKDLARAVPASTALQKGSRPLLVVFYDETSKASRLSAADLWPVVLEVEPRVDLVLVDLTPGPGRPISDDERRLVRRYYLGYVPTTVVLTSDRSPRLLKSGRVEPALVRAACLEAK
ncbi:MAG: hypothetical protein IT460_00675 [Planctomycetes bacterium]|nr:hypothetical protein [Planctomycetota bacterium]